MVNVPVKNNKVLSEVLSRVNSHERLHAIWESCNVMAVNRLGMSDHGQVHVSIVANLAIKILRNLVGGSVVPSIVKDYSVPGRGGFSVDDAEVVVFLASLMHDLGNSVHRDLHDDIGFVLAVPLINELLDGLYGVREKQIMVSEVLHAMVAHDTGVAVHTVEGGVVRIADGLDMKKGRARIGFEAGKKDIFNVSAMAIEDVRLLPPEGKKLVRVEILMSDAAGIFQVDYLLKKKIKGSGLERFIEVVAKSLVDGKESLIDNYVIN